MGIDRLRLALAAHLAIGSPARVLAVLRDGGIEAIARRSRDLHPTSQDRVERDAKELNRQAIGAVFLGEAQYPTRLAQLPAPPPILYYRGNLDLLNAASVGMCGARDASVDGLEAARVAGRTVAAAGLAIVSGNARGVDTETHVAAIAAGGSTIIVLAEGIARFRVKSALRAAGLDPAQLLVLSQFPPRQGWTVGGAMTRNAIIAGLGVALVVIEAGASGGTLDAGLKGIELKRPVLALDFQSGARPGNELLFNRGAIRVSSTGELRRAIADIQAAIETGQLELFDYLTAATPADPVVRSSL